MLFAYQKAFTNDRNIPNDSVWAFHTVLFNTAGGSSIKPSETLTVEDGKAAAWPESDPSRSSALVLITCEDESAEGGYLNRRVILAEPQ